MSDDDRELPAALAETVGMTVTFRTLTPHGRALMDTLGVNVVFAADAPHGCPDHEAVEDRKPLTEEQRRARAAYAREHRRRRRASFAD